MISFPAGAMALRRRRLAQPLLGPVVTLVAAALLLAYQFKILILLTGIRPNVLKDDLGTTVPVESNTSVDRHEQIKKVEDNSIGQSQNITCDSSPCNGFFAYEGPNKDKKAALEVFQKAVAEYGYPPERNNETHNKLIFMPNSSNHPSCVIDGLLYRNPKPKA